VLALRAPEIFTRKGPFRFTRSPLFIELILVFFRLVLVAGSKTGLAPAVLHGIFWNLYGIIKEEADLEKKFGDEYRRYRALVPR